MGGELVDCGGDCLGRWWLFRSSGGGEVGFSSGKRRLHLVRLDGHKARMFAKFHWYYVRSKMIKANQGSSICGESCGVLIPAYVDSVLLKLRGGRERFGSKINIDSYNKKRSYVRRGLFADIILFVIILQRYKGESAAVCL